MNKILIIGPNSIHVKNFIEIINPLFNEIQFIGEEKVDFLAECNQSVCSFRSKNPFVLFRKYLKLKKLIKEVNPNVIHFQSINRQAFFGILANKYLNIKVVSTAWGSDVLLVPERSKILKKMVSFVLKRSDYITADSNQMIEKIETLSNNRNIKHCLFGIEPIKEKEKEKIIYSNRLHNELYNIEKIIIDFKEFSKNQPEWKLIIGAIGSETKRLIKLAVGNEFENKIKFVGWLDKETNEQYYQKAMIYVSIPDSDGTAISLLEAMSAGCIPVVSNLKVSEEWIQNNVNGIILEKNENCFERALNLNQKNVSKLNTEIINLKATRVVARNNFNEIYSIISVLDDN
jgi:glycosyltransferase involved in cell wall biosynthesis